MNPKDISIIITCHNLEKYLVEAVESIHNQTLTPLETIIVHDSCEDPRPIYGTSTYMRENNIGVAKSRHEGYRLAQGDYLLFMDADDVLTETYLWEMRKTIKTCDIAYPDVLIWNTWSDKEQRDNQWWSPAQTINKRTMTKSNQVVATSLMKRAVYEKIGGFEEMEMYEDCLFWNMALRSGFTFKKANTYLKYRQRASGRNQGDADMKKRAYKAMKDKLYVFDTYK